jgi:hypothetical protein
VRAAEETLVILALCVAVYLALPLVVASRYWRGGRRLAAVSWLIACVAGPALVGWVALQALDARMPPARESGDAVSMVVNAGLIGLGAWLGLCALAWRLNGRPRPKP